MVKSATESVAKLEVMLVMRSMTKIFSNKFFFQDGFFCLSYELNHFCECTFFLLSNLRLEGIQGCYIKNNSVPR